MSATDTAEAVAARAVLYTKLDGNQNGQISLSELGNGLRFVINKALGDRAEEARTARAVGERGRGSR